MTKFGASAILWQVSCYTDRVKCFNRCLAVRFPLIRLMIHWPRSSVRLIAAILAGIAKGASDNSTLSLAPFFYALLP